MRLNIVLFVKYNTIYAYILNIYIYILIIYCIISTDTIIIVI